MALADFFAIYINEPKTSDVRCWKQVILRPNAIILKKIHSFIFSFNLFSGFLDIFTGKQVKNIYILKEKSYVMGEPLWVSQINQPMFWCFKAKTLIWATFNETSKKKKSKQNLPSNSRMMYSRKGFLIIWFSAEYKKLHRSFEEFSILMKLTDS